MSSPCRGWSAPSCFPYRPELFGEGARPAAFTLVDNKVTTKGVLIARYQRAGNVVAGDFAMDPPTPAEVARRDRMNREG